MTSGALVTFERVLRITPLGLRFIDEVYGQTVSGLAVTATLLDGPARTVQAQLGRGCSGIYAFHDLAGVRTLYEEEDQPTLDIGQLWQGAPKFSYRIEVRDLRGRYLPCRSRYRLQGVGRPGFRCLPWTLSPSFPHRRAAFLRGRGECAWTLARTGGSHRSK